MRYLIYCLQSQVVLVLFEENQAEPGDAHHGDHRLLVDVGLLSVALVSRSHGYINGPDDPNLVWVGLSDAIQPILCLDLARVVDQANVVDLQVFVTFGVPVAVVGQQVLEHFCIVLVPPVHIDTVPVALPGGKVNFISLREVVRLISNAGGASQNELVGGDLVEHVLGNRFLAEPASCDFPIIYCGTGIWRKQIQIVWLAAVWLLIASKSQFLSPI